MDESALLAEIAANPEADAPRLVYADLLTQRGDPRGELIHLQVLWKRDDNVVTLQHRVGELLRAHKAAWTTEAGITGALTTFVRGFPKTLVGTAEEIWACRDALRTQPITSLAILSQFDGLAEVMALPELARISDLKLSGGLDARARETPIPPDLLAAVARSPYLTNLRSLHLDDGAVDGDTVRLLATAAWLPAIELLIVAHSPLTAAGMAELAPRLVAVRRLGMPQCNLDSQSAAALAASPLRQLDLLWMPGNSIGASGLAALAASPLLSTVTILDVTNNYVTSDGVAALARSPHVGALCSLGLELNGIGPDGAAALAASTQLRSLADLDLRRNRVGHEGVAALAAATGLPALRRLGITDNNIGTGVFERHEPGSEADTYGGPYEVQETAEQIAARFTHRTGLELH